jgi:hypothetical protein
MSDPTVVPAQLGRYRILSKLGQGGMGAVYLAEDTLLSRRVAVKVPHFTPDDGPTVIARFHREARTAAAIDHPHICPVHDAGEVDGVHFLVMPYIEGSPLSRLIDSNNPWSPARAAALIRQLALAVEALHQRGLIHRDLKPSNVLIRPDGSPVLMDFGLARSFTEQGRRLTQSGAALGTPAYMAPEQILGESASIGPATDVYELGVILYELLAGGLPFGGAVCRGVRPDPARATGSALGPPSRARRGAGRRVPEGAGEEAGGALRQHGRLRGGADSVGQAGGGRRRAAPGGHAEAARRQGVADHLQGLRQIADGADDVGRQAAEVPALPDGPRRRRGHAAPFFPPGRRRPGHGAAEPAGGGGRPTAACRRGGAPAEPGRSGSSGGRRGRLAAAA